MKWKQGRGITASPFLIIWIKEILIQQEAGKATDLGGFINTIICSTFRDIGFRFLIIDDLIFQK